MLSALPDFWSVVALASALSLSRPGSRLTGWRLFVTGMAAGGILGGVLSGRLDEAGISALALAVLAWDWWNRKGKRAAKALGAKSRALVAGLVERLRDALEPAPEGARA